MSMRENSFGSFVSSSKTRKGVPLSNQYDNILNNMIQPLIEQPNEIIYGDIKDLVIKARIKEAIEIEIENQELDVT